MTPPGGNGVGDGAGTGAAVAAGAPTRERRCELLAAADPAEVVELAERCLEDGARPTVLAGPEVGVIALQVREPIAAERFYLGEVLVTQAEVAVGDGRGWAMRMGGDRVATLAAAVLDAEVEAGRSRTAEVLALCQATERRLRADDAREWEELAATEVSFEELD